MYALCNQAVSRTVAATRTSRSSRLSMSDEPWNASARAALVVSNTLLLQLLQSLLTRLSCNEYARACYAPAVMPRGRSVSTNAA
jgi:hypothetical protein